MSLPRKRIPFGPHYGTLKIHAPIQELLTVSTQPRCILCALIATFFAAVVALSAQRASAEESADQGGDDNGKNDGGQRTVASHRCHANR